MGTALLPGRGRPWKGAVKRGTTRPMIKAVLFDFGGTLYDYSCLAAAEAESLVELARHAGATEEPHDILMAQRDAMRRVFRDYLPKPFYLHRDLFRDAVVGMLEELGLEARADQLDRYRKAQWERHRRDFALRDGAIDTLRELRDRRLHVGMVSNIDDDQLEHLLTAAGIADLFDSILSSEQARSCKPDPRIYEIALRRAGCAAPEALFVGDTLRQDIAGANQAGMRSALLWHRQDREPPADGARPHHVIRSIPEVLNLVGPARP
jgi:2-haloalkanoic acid dehalogenase type II